ncbi:MAG TPA: 30S ribosomal protein S4 [Candidatus Hydrogenedentes bacterium]|nr:30S ribosomal protein S4 [Candidatus Hydrogenedentota bacterium]HOL75854.1 30S ribosomal protein S4 [Candidatus Hydrogenedentota bacterium]HPO86355.1 30S ribosomal protein S4 [Candidatus Hydrogenedentota bacterium]
MARYIGPRHKLCRTLGSCIWGSPKCPSVKRPYPPGQHGPNLRRKLTVYGQQLLEKQKIQKHYGILERQMRRTFEKAQRMGGVTGTNLLMLLESRLDTVIYRLGYANTIFAARQLVSHGHVLVDGKACNIPSFQVKPGMTVSIREKSRKIPMIEQGAENPPAMIPEYLERAPKSFEGRMVSQPTLETIPFKADTAGVIGFYSR